MEEEISLRQLIETLWRGRTIIIGITLVAVFTAAILSFFVLPPVYEATAVFMLNQQLFASEQQPPGLEGLMDALWKLPRLSLQTYANQIKKSELALTAMKKLGLDKEYTVRQFLDKVEISIPKDTSLVESK